MISRNEEKGATTGPWAEGLFCSGNHGRAAL